jgi:hypothetical protein
MIFRNARFPEGKTESDWDADERGFTRMRQGREEPESRIFRLLKKPELSLRGAILRRGNLEVLAFL